MDTFNCEDPPRQNDKTRPYRHYPFSCVGSPCYFWSYTPVVLNMQWPLTSPRPPVQVFNGTRKWNVVVTYVKPETIKQILANSWAP